VSLFELLRERVPLEEVIGRYSEVREDKARCVAPNHADANPSMHVYDDHVYCFSCGFRGDVVDMWAATRGFGRPVEAALDLAREFGVELPEWGPEARRKAQERREREAGYLRQAEACSEALSRHARVAQWWEERGFGRELWERFLLGSSEDGTAAVIPFWCRGRVQGLIRRNLQGDRKYLYPNAEDFPGGHRPLFVPGPVRAGAYLVEGIVDALALAALGESVVAVGGTHISREQMRELRSIPAPLYLLPDADEQGAEAARGWARQLYPEALLCPAGYGEGRKDPADLFAADGQGAGETLKDLQAGATDALGLELLEAPEGEDSLRAYRAAKERVLPLLLKLEDRGERDAALKDVAAALKLSVKPLRKALAAAEAEEGESEDRGRPGAEDAVPSPGTERHERAMGLLKRPDLLEEAVRDMGRLGHVGERATKKLALICALSARSRRPIQPSTHAQSSAGKNALWDTALSLLPEEMVVRRSGLSAKALFRTEADLKGAVLYLQEVAGSEDANYSIRVMQSDGRLEYEATEKTPDGSMKNVVYRTEGPTVIVQTTTKNHLHPENETRVFPIYIDESEEQTGRIVEGILREAAGEGTSEAEREGIRQRWRDAIRLLERGEVVIPYAGRIEVPSSPIRVRRDARRLVDVVRVIAWMHQHRRERDAEDRILAAEEDFALALALVSESLRRAWQTLTPAEETVLRVIEKLPEQLKTRGFRRRDLKVKGASDRRAKEVLKSLTDTGYLDCDGRAGPQGYSYTVAREAEEVSLGISLRPPPDAQESPANGDDTTGRDAPARYRPVLDEPDEGDGHREAGATGRNGHRPTKTNGLQEERATRRAGDGRARCIHGFAEGAGCYLCDPNHPYRLKEGK
jgi:DNA primase